MLSAEGSPTTDLAAAAFAAFIASSIRDCGTNIRVGALQDCPLLPKQPATPPETARAKSGTSLRIMFADLPPSS